MQEEDILKQEKIESVYLATTFHDNATNKKKKWSNNNKGK